jgi:undecaprenyl diphosphate synthase
MTRSPAIYPLPQHVAIIMDGNGRWAQQRHLPRLAGHRAGVENLRRVVECFVEWGVPYLTIYAFSTENWTRPPEEVQGLMQLLQEALERETLELHRQGVRIRHLGSLEGIDPQLQRAICDALKLTERNTRLTLSVAFNYGGRAEILQAVRRVLQDGVPPEALDEARFKSYLFTHDLPDPDLIIRTAGEMRLSNFLLWQAAYAEFYSVPTYWPDFGPAEIEEAFRAYSQRQRRFGGLPKG